MQSGFLAQNYSSINWTGVQCSTSPGTNYSVGDQVYYARLRFPRGRGGLYSIWYMFINEFKSSLYFIPLILSIQFHEIHF